MNISYLSYLLVILILLIIDYAETKKKVRQGGRRIVGGAHVHDPHEFPFMVLITYKRVPICGGTIIDHYYILTAAHCMVGPYFKHQWAFDVHVGLLDPNYVKTVKVKILHPHPYFNITSLEYDIGLMELAVPLNFSQSVRDVPLPFGRKTILSNTMCQAIGFGSTFRRTHNLRVVNLNAISPEECQFFWRTEIKEYHICTLMEKGGKDTCQGDSGGPLLCHNSQRGIVSFGRGCGRRMVPSVYVNVAYFEDWILAVITRATGTMIYPTNIAVSIYFGGKGPYCGGSLVTMAVVLTVAHCLVNKKNVKRPAYKYSVRVGSNLHHTRQTRHCKSTIAHPDYDPETDLNDVGLLQMKEMFSMSETCQRTVLPCMSNVSYDFLKDVVTCTLLGWGTVVPGERVPSTLLKEVSVPTISHEDCSKNWAYPLHPHQMCTQFSEGGKDACQGDSGGPVVCDNVQRGIVAKGIGCGNPDGPSIHTSVDFFEPWIIKTTCKMEGLEEDLCLAKLKNRNDPVSSGYKRNNNYYKYVMIQILCLFFKQNFPF